MQKYKSNITTTSGAAVRGVPVLVIDEDGNNAALFRDRAGTVPAQNPLTTGPDGVFYFYAVNGRYSLRTTVDGVTITDDDVVLMMDPEEITVAGPIAEAVAAAQAAATAAETAVANSGIPVLVSSAQNAVVDANAALAQAIASSSSAALSKTDADAARDAAVTAKMAAEAALDSFDDRYLGAKAVAPTVDNDGAALLIGALYWDTELPGMRSWNGSAWVTLQAATAAAISNTPAGSIAATTVQSAIDELDAEKAPLSSPALTGTPTAPTAAPGTNTTQLATTEYARAAAIAFGGIKAYATKAEAAIASALLPDGSDIEVAQDESLSGSRTRYKVQAGALVFVVNLDQVRLDLANATDPTKGAGMIGYDGGTVQTVLDDAKPMADYVALRAYTGRATSVRITQAGLAGGFQRDASDTTSADNGGTIIVDASGRRWHRIFSGVVVDKWFEAVGDTVADDTVAIQKAIDYCNSFPQALSLGMTGVCRITSPLVINRQVDTTQTDFNVIGLGKGGFYVDTQISIFTSTLPGTTCSEFITFNGVVFLTPTYGLGATVLTSKFLRVQAINCTFERILFANFDTTYAQTFRFSNCRIRSWEGLFFNTRGSYDIDFDGNIIEHGGSLFRSVDPSGNTGSLGNRFRGNLIEGLSGIAITQNVTRGLEVSGNYTELNMGPLLALNYDLLPQYGINFSGNMTIVPAAKLADPEFFVVQWGASSTASSSGNYTDGRLHDNKSMTGPLESSGDVGEIALFRGNGTGITDASRGGAAGTVFGVDKNSKILYVTNGYVWSGIDPTFGAFVTGPVVNDSGTLVPIRIMVGAVNPQGFPASYGNPFWALGSRVFHSNPAIGQPKGWICTGSGRPGTWVEEGTL